MVTRTERTKKIEQLEQEFSGASGIYLTDINKINVEKMTAFRRNLREAGASYVVVKNTLARIALEKCGMPDVIPFLKGPVGIAVTKEDATNPAKVIKDFKKENKDLLDLKVAMIEGNVYNAQEATKIAELPSREVLLSQFLSCLNAPMSNFVGALNGIFTKFVGTLEAVKKQKEADN